MVVHFSIDLGITNDYYTSKFPWFSVVQRGGFPLSEHLDIVPEVIQRMRQKYPAEQWPGAKQSGGLKRSTWAETRYTRDFIIYIYIYICIVYVLFNIMIYHYQLYYDDLPSGYLT